MTFHKERPSFNLKQLCLAHAQIFINRVKNYLIFNLSWGGMKGPCGSFPCIMIKIVIDVTW